MSNHIDGYGEYIDGLTPDEKKAFLNGMRNIVQSLREAMANIEIESNPFNLSSRDLGLDKEDADLIKAIVIKSHAHGVQDMARQWNACMERTLLEIDEAQNAIQ